MKNERRDAETQRKVMKEMGFFCASALLRLNGISLK